MEEATNIFIEHPRITFWVRFIIWAMLACALPVAFIAWRFDLFTTVSKISFGGWGIVAVIIVFFFGKSLLGYVKTGLKGHVFISQCISGICKVLLPLVCLYAVLWSIRNSLDSFLQALGFTIITETIAIPFNPMPQWVHDNVKEEDRKKFESATDLLWDKFFSRKGEE